MKSISTINPANMENTDGTIIKARAPVIDIKVSVPVALVWCIITLRFASRALQAPLLALHLSKSHTKAITHVPQIVTYAVRDKGMEYKGEQR